jgi:phosphoglycerol transferase MdoB-like AlkP superfamily enzyme
MHRRWWIAVRRLRRFLSGQRIRPLVLVAVYAYVLFTVFRGGLLLLATALFPERPFEGVTLGELLHCFGVGFYFDSMAVGYVLLPMAVALTLASESVVRKRGFRWCVTLYAAATSVWLLALEVVGVGFFLHYGTRLDWKLAYYTQSAHEVWGYLFHEYYIWAWLLLVPPLCYGVYRLYRRAFWVGHVSYLPGWRRGAVMAVVLGICVLACRGGFDSRPLNRSKACFTTNNLVAQLAMNNNYTLYGGAVTVLDDDDEERDRFDMKDMAEARQIARRLLWQEADQPVAGSPNPMWRRTATGRPMRRRNVVLIMMESMAGRHIGALGYPHSQTPHLDAICREGLFFSNVYAVGAQTSRGLVGTLCGHPDLSGMTLLARPTAQGRFLTLPGLLQQRNYRTVFLSCGKPSFDSMDVFFAAGGVERIIGEEEMSAEPASTWGVSDEYVYNKAINVFGDIHQRDDGPFFGMILTISNHEPYHVPRGRVALLAGDEKETRVINATRYADWALGRFFREAASEPWFDETMFVLVADTGRQFEYDRSRLIDATGFRVPLVFYAPGRIEPDVIGTVGSQTDIAPTLLAMLGGTYEHGFLGRNLLAVEPGDGFALLHQYDRLGFVRDGRLLVLPPKRQPPVLYRVGSDLLQRVATAEEASRARQMHRDMLGLYSMAWLLYKDGLYRSPAAIVAEAAQTATR